MTSPDAPPDASLRLVDQFDAFLIDLDGVVYLGDSALPGAVQTVGRLRQAGKTVRFLTNDPRPTRFELVQRLATLGIEAAVEEIITCGWATATHLYQQGTNPVSVVGSPGLAGEIRAAGLDITETDQPHAVVVGCDEDTSYRDLARATGMISQGTQFVATNTDGAFPSPAGPLPATGALVAAIQAATQHTPLVIGKPSPAMFHAALDGLPPDTRTIVLGDSPSTDILGAHNVGLPAALVAAKPASFPAARDFRTPDVTLSSLTDLFTPGIARREWLHPPFSWPDTIKAGVAAVVFDQSGAVLLQRRADNSLWGLPSGHVEPGETVEEAVTREVAEETGLHVRTQRLIGIYSDPDSQAFTYPSGKTTHFITCCFLCHITHGTLQHNSPETHEVAFFCPEQLPADLLPMHPQWLTDALSNQTTAFVR